MTGQIYAHKNIIEFLIVIEKNRLAPLFFFFFNATSMNIHFFHLYLIQIHLVQ